MEDICEKIRVPENDRHLGLRIWFWSLKRIQRIICEFSGDLNDICDAFAAFLEVAEYIDLPQTERRST